MQRYRDRREAGQILAAHLEIYKDQPDTIVLALPRGGVPVAFEIATHLHLPLDVFIVRKLGVPGHPELAMGAMATGGMHVFNKDILQQLHISKEEIDFVIQKEQKELARRELAYRGDKPFPDLKHKKVILVDDGVATGATMRAALKALREFNPKAIIVAVPVIDASLVDQMEALCDVLVCPRRPDALYAVGAWYEDFSQTEDEEVYDLLSKR